MKSSFDPEIHHRRSIRRRGFDYSSAGAYFVTIVVRYRLCLFGDIENNELICNPAGAMVVAQWLHLGIRFPFCTPTDFVVMPNHFHGILVLQPGDDWKPLENDQEPDAPRGTLKNSLGRVMQAFKSCSTDDYIQGVYEQDWPRFEKKLWLRNYWDRILRDDEEWGRAQDYIAQNPRRWIEDKHHPETNFNLRAARANTQKRP